MDFQLLGDALAGQLDGGEDVPLRAREQDRPPSAGGPAGHRERNADRGRSPAGALTDPGIGRERSAGRGERAMARQGRGQEVAALTVWASSREQEDDQDGRDGQAPVVGSAGIGSRGGRGRWRGGSGGVGGEEARSPVEIGAATGTQQAVGSDLGEAARQDMLKKPVQESVHGQRDAAGRAGPRVGMVKRDVTVSKPVDPLIGERHAIDVAREIERGVLAIPDLVDMDGPAPTPHAQVDRVEEGRERRHEPHPPCTAPATRPSPMKTTATTSKTAPNHPLVSRKSHYCWLLWSAGLDQMRALILRCSLLGACASRATLGRVRSTPHRMLECARRRGTRIRSSLRGRASGGTRKPRHHSRNADAA